MKKQRVIKFLTREEVSHIFNSCDSSPRGLRDKALLAVLFSTGLRISEALALLRDKITPELAIVGKGGRQRVVYFSPNALKAIQAYENDRIDIDPRLFPITIRQAQRVIKYRAEQAGIDKSVHPHMLRHSMACNLLKQGVSVFHVQRFLGHSDLATTAVYLHASDSELAEIHKKIYE